MPRRRKQLSEGFAQRTPRPQRNFRLFNLRDLCVLRARFNQVKKSCLSQKHEEHRVYQMDAVLCCFRDSVGGPSPALEVDADPTAAFTVHPKKRRVSRTAAKTTGTAAHVLSVTDATEMKRPPLSAFSSPPSADGLRPSIDTNAKDTPA